MLGQLERRISQADPWMNAPPRYRRACAYETFIPIAIEELNISMSGAVAASVSTAEAAIKGLNTDADHDLAPLARLLLRNESIASSKVEGMQVDTRALARAEVSNELGQGTTRTALEVIGNIDAMILAIENANAEERVTVDQLIGIHRALIERAPNPEIAGGSELNKTGSAAMTTTPAALTSCQHPQRKSTLYWVISADFQATIDFRPSFRRLLPMRSSKPFTHLTMETGELAALLSKSFFADVVLLPPMSLPSALCSPRTKTPTSAD